MKIAVTAASGQLGSAIVQAVLEALPPEQVVAIARNPEKVAHLGVEFRKGDYDSREDFDQALKGIDGVVILSGNTRPEDRIQQHRNIIHAAKEAGVQKIVYTSVSGDFGPVVRSNRQTEEDVRNSGMECVIGRNGIYIEPDVEYIEQYVADGKIRNSAGDGKCAYTTRPELGYAYRKMLLEPAHNGKTYHLGGTAISQQELAAYLNFAFGTNLTYEAMSIEAYRVDRIAATNEFFGGVIASIYESIGRGDFDLPSDFEAAAGRPHISWSSYFQQIKDHSKI